MRAPVHAPTDDIDIKALWGTVRASLPRLALFCVATGALTFLLLSLVAPRYVSEAQLAIVAKGRSNPYADPTRAATTPESVSVRMDKEAVNTHLRAMMSPDLAAKIAADMKLADRTEFNSALGAPDRLSTLLRLAGFGGPRAGESEQDRVLGAYFNRLEVYSPKESRFIGIRFSSSNPELAAEIANKLAETYRETLASQSIVETDEVQQALEPKIAKLAEEVAAAEDEAQRFRGAANIFKGGQQATGLNEQQLAELTAELSKVQGARSEAEARTKSAREMQKLGSADALPDVQKSPLIQNLVQQRVRAERQVSELSATLLPRHPRMRQLNADLKGLKLQIEVEVAKVVDSLDKEAKVEALREESITKSLNDIKARIVTTGPDEVKLRSLEANAKSKRAELERLQSQYEANRGRADSRSVPVEAQIVTRARPSSVPSFPRKVPYALLVMAATLLLGMALVVTSGLLLGTHRARVAWGRRRGDAAAQREIGDEPILGVAPGPSAAPTTESTLPPSERIATMSSIIGMASRIAAKAPGTGGYRTLVAGESDGVEPGEAAAELAKALADKGDAVIIVAWCPEGDGMAARSGMNELLDGAATFEDVVSALPGSKAHFIASGEIQAEPAAALDPDRISLVLDALDEAYDHIIVVARYEDARALFELIQGRFDAGVTVSDAQRRASLIHEPPDTFLGFEVEGIELIRFERPAALAIAGERGPVPVTRDVSRHTRIETLGSHR